MYQKFEHDEFIKAKVKDRLKFLYHPCVGLSYLLSPSHAAEGFFFADDKLDFAASIRDLASKTHPHIVEEISNELMSFLSDMSKLPESRKQFVLRMSAEQYWNIAGVVKYPNLAKIALKISSMICSSAISERTWSTFNFIHSRLRNRLTTERVNKLVFIYTNCVSLDGSDKNDYILEEGAVVNGNDCEL
jgi:hypothetical protein